MQNTVKLCELVGGSHLYNLHTPQSDVDRRGIFMSTESKYILGTARFDEHRKQNTEEDTVFKEVGHWVRLLNQANTEAFEVLFAPTSAFSLRTLVFDLFRSHANNLIDSRKLLNCLRGYAQSEYRLSKGERSGVLGSKRKEALDKYGYSHRNASHLLRLLYTGIVFFREDRYVVDCRDFGPDVYKYIWEIKNNPTSYNVELLEKDYKDLDRQIVDAYENRKITHSFNEKIANQLLLACYLPYLLTEFGSNKK